MTRNAAVGGVLLALIEGLTMLITRTFTPDAGAMYEPGEAPGMARKSEDRGRARALLRSGLQ